MRLYRLAAARYASTLWSGQGGLLGPARWHSRPRLVVYAAGSLALAQLEKLAQYRDRSQIPGQVVGWLDVPDVVRPDVVDAAVLPKHWRQPSPLPRATQALGDDWIERGGSLLLRVPSALSPSDFNYLLNPGNADLAKCKKSVPAPFAFDPRLAR